MSGHGRVSGVSPDVGPPIRLEELYDQYRESKRQVVTSVTRQMEDSIRGMLQELSRESTPLDLEA